MTHSKPQVTIDLAEYNELLAAKNTDSSIVKDYDKFVRLLLKLLNTSIAPTDPKFGEQQILTWLNQNGCLIKEEDGIIKFKIR